MVNIPIPSVATIRNAINSLRNSRIKLGTIGAAVGAAAAGLAIYAAKNTSGVSLVDQYKGQTLQFPRDVSLHGNYMELRALATNGVLASSLAGQFPGFFANLIGTNGATIVLPLPNNLQAAHDPSYEDKNLGFPGNIAKAYDRQLYGGGAPNATTMAASASVSGFAQAAGAGLTGITAGSIDQNVALKLAAGVAQNPQKILLFTGMNFRTFSYSWRLSPRNYDESVAIKSITDALIYYAHPAYTGGGAFLKYPEFFNIKFSKDKFLHKFQPAVIDSITVDFQPQGYAAYKRSDSNQNDPAPAEVQLNITFKEVEIVTKQSLSGILGTGFS